MEEYIAFDSHKRYTWVEHQEANTGKTRGLPAGARDGSDSPGAGGLRCRHSGGH